MKKNSTIIMSAAALAIAGTMYAVSSGAPHLVADQSLASPVPAARTHNMHKAPAKASEGFDMWLSRSKSQFGDDTRFTFSDGPEREYATEVSISGDKVRIKGLFDLYYDDIDAEYVIEGVYDQRAGTVTIPVTKFDSDKTGIEGYVKAAEMYSLTTDQPYTLVVFAGDMNEQGDLNTQDGLVFTLSDDLDRMTAKSGFGLYAFDAQGRPMAFYDYYKSCTIALPQEGINLGCSHDKIDFSGLYVCTGMEQTASVYVINRGRDDASVSVSTTSPDISVSQSEATIASCQRHRFDIVLNSSTPGRIDEDVIFAWDGGQELRLHVGVDVHERPDYTLICSNGGELMEFDFSPAFPFVIDNVDGQTVAVSLNSGDNTESWFTASVDIPEGKVGVFSFKGFQENKQPNGFVLSLDRVEIANYAFSSSSYDPMPVGNTVIIPSGRHTLGFSHVMVMDWVIYSGVAGRAYVYDLDLQLIDASESGAILEEDSVTFDDAYFDSLTTTRHASVRLHNIGNEPLRVNSCEGTGGFSAQAPDMSAANGSYIDVPLTWTVSAVGEETGTVILHTTAGDLTVECLGNAKAIPDEYHNIVTQGDFSFDTDTAYPFALNEAKGYLYNSNSKTEYNEISYSWLEASFIVPEGSVGKLSWDAYNDSEDPFYMMGVPSIVSGTTFTLDGAKEQAVGGLNVHCGATNIYTPGDLIFGSGRHSVRFCYKKTFSDPNRVFGGDRLKLFELSLELIGNGEIKGYVLPESCDFKGIDYSVERDGHQTIGVVNYAGEPVQLLSWDAVGPFSVVDLSEYAYEGTTPFMVEYHPTLTGEETGSVTLHTSIGDFTVPCVGHGIDLKRGGQIFYESFEYGYNGWLMEDYDGDGLGWMPMSGIISEYEAKYAALPYGYQAIGTVLYDYSNYRYLPTPVDNVTFSPEIEIPADGITSLYFMTCTKTFNGDGIEVYVGEDADTYLDLYDKVYDYNFGDITEWREHAVDLTKYAGKKVRVAFRVNTPEPFNAYFIIIDDVLVTNSLVSGRAGADGVTAEAEVVATEYYSPDGIRLEAPCEGVNIVVTRYSDGRTSTSKTMRKANR